MDKSHYQFVENDLSELYGVKLTNKDLPYYGVVIVYGVVTFKENPETKNMVLNFQYQIIKDTQTHTKEDLDKDKDFKNYLGKLLEYIIENESLTTRNDKPTEK